MSIYDTASTSLRVQAIRIMPFGLEIRTFLVFKSSEKRLGRIICVGD